MDTFASQVLLRPYSGTDILTYLRINGKIYPLGNLETCSVSTHRDTTPVRGFGEDAPIDYWQGTRTISGTMVLAKVHYSELDKVIEDNPSLALGDIRGYKSPDRMPAIDLLFVKCTEYGEHVRNGMMPVDDKTSAELLGVKFMSSGFVMSVHDVYSEQTFCVDDETEALTSNGWKKRWEINPITDLLLTINTETKDIQWQKPEGVYSFVYDGDLIHWKNYRGVDALTTPNHRWITANYGQYARKGIFHTDLTFKETHELTGTSNCVMLAGGAPTCFKEEKVYSDELVSLYGWAATEGTLISSKAGTPYGIMIIQSREVNQPNCDELADLASYFKEKGITTSIKPKSSCNGYYFGKGIMQFVPNVSPKQWITPEFLMNLTLPQAEMLHDILIKADGNIDERSDTTVFIQNPGFLADSYQMLCSMLGKRTRRSEHGPACTKTRVYQSQLLQCYHLKPTTVHYSGMVWCPKTPNMTWLARRNNCTFWTGNTYVAREYRDFNQTNIPSNRDVGVDIAHFYKTKILNTTNPDRNSRS